MDSPDFDEPMFGYVPDEEDKFIEEDGSGRNPSEENGHVAILLRTTKRKKPILRLVEILLKNAQMGDAWSW